MRLLSSSSALRDWSKYPTRTSPRFISPLLGFSNPSKILIRVLLPLPFRPTIAIRSPCKTRALKSLKSCLPPMFLLNCLISKSIFLRFMLCVWLKFLLARSSSSLTRRITPGFFFASSRMASTRSLRPSLRFRRALTPRRSHSSSDFSCFSSVSWDLARLARISSFLAR